MGCQNVKGETVLQPVTPYVPSSVAIPEKLHVLTCLFMPIYSEVRVTLFRDFQKHMQQFPEVTVWVIEAILPGMQYHVTNVDNPQHFRVLCQQPLWIKENLLNILIKKLPPSAKFIAWIDADVTFFNRNWARDAIQKLKTVDVIQLFEDSDFMGPNGQIQASAKSLMYYACQNLPMIKEFNKRPQTYPHPGYAWAMNSAYLEKIGGFFESNIVGSGDKLMAYAIFGMWEYGLQAGYKLTPGFLQACKQWASSAIPDKGFGYIPGKIRHNYHGQRQDRNYVNRWLLLEKYNFHPAIHLMHNRDGVLQLKLSMQNMQKEIKQYFVSRKEHLVPRQQSIKGGQAKKMLPPLSKNSKKEYRKQNDQNDPGLVDFGDDQPDDSNNIPYPQPDNNNNQDNNHHPHHPPSPHHSSHSHGSHNSRHSQHSHRPHRSREKHNDHHHNPQEPHHPHEPYPRQEPHRPHEPHHPQQPRHPQEHHRPDKPDHSQEPRHSHHPQESHHHQEPHLSQHHIPNETNHHQSIHTHQPIEHHREEHHNHHQDTSTYQETSHQNDTSHQYSQQHHQPSDTHHQASADNQHPSGFY